jgi:hypothetical protein
MRCGDIDPMAPTTRHNLFASRRYPAVLQEVANIERLELEADADGIEPGDIESAGDAGFSLANKPGKNAKSGCNAFSYAREIHAQSKLTAAKLRQSVVDACDSHAGCLTVQQQATSLQYHVGVQAFKTQKEAVGHMQTLFDDAMGSTKSLTIAKDTDLFDVLMSVLNAHSKRDEKIGNGVDFFKVENAPGRGCKVVIHHTDPDDEAVSFSWQKCIKKKWNTNEQQAYRAFRFSVTDQTEGYRNSLSAKERVTCTLCGSVGNRQFDVDHCDLQFKELVNTFTSTHGLQTELIDGGEHKYSFKDDTYSKEWKAFHKRHATYRILCHDCNCKRKKAK